MKHNQTLSAISTSQANVLASSTLKVDTSGRGFIDVTASIEEFLAQAGGVAGAVTIFVRHTSASLTIQENADPGVLTDLNTALERLAPESGGWVHDAEGPDDMPAHIKTMLTSSGLHIPVIDSKLTLGTWQGVYVIEHRAAPHRRELVLQFIGTIRV